MIMPFYSKMYELYPYNEDDPFDEKDGHPFNKKDMIEIPDSIKNKLWL